MDNFLGPCNANNKDVWIPGCGKAAGDQSIGSLLRIILHWCHFWCELLYDPAIVAWVSTFEPCCNNSFILVSR